MIQKDIQIHGTDITDCLIAVCVLDQELDKASGNDNIGVETVFHCVLFCQIGELIDQIFL